MQLEIQPYQNQKAVSTKTQHLPERRELSLISGQTGCDLQVVQVVERSFMQDNIRAAAKHNLEETVLGLTVILEACAKVYCGGAKTDEEVYKEAVKFTMRQFGHLNADEIKQAFALGAAGSLDLGTEDMTTFYGLFTIGMLGKILKAYDVYRSRIVSKMLLGESAKREDVKREQWNENAWGVERMQKFMSLEKPTYTDFSDTDYRYFTKTGQLEHTQDEKRKAWEDARLITMLDIEGDANTEQNRNMAALLKKTVREAKEGNENEKFTIRRTAIAKQLLVMRWIESKHK